MRLTKGQTRASNASMMLKKTKPRLAVKSMLRAGANDDARRYHRGGPHSREPRRRLRHVHAARYGQRERRAGLSVGVQGADSRPAALMLRDVTRPESLREPRHERTKRGVR